MLVEDKVDARCYGWLSMAPKWALIEDLVGGTEAMKAAGAKWLPKEEAERPQAYQNRLERSTLFGAYADTLKTLSGKPFSREVVLPVDPPKRLLPIVRNVDKTGRDLTDFMRGALWSAMQYGVLHGLVDFAKNPGVRADNDNLRARFVMYEAPKVIGWRQETIDGDPVLTQVRLLENKIIPVGSYGEEQVEDVRVYERDRWRLYRKNDRTGEFYPLGPWQIHSFGAVPLVSLYTDRTGFMTATPPLYDLAEVNLAHWRSWSQQVNIVHAIRCAILLAAGFTKRELDTIVVSPWEFVKTERPKDEVFLGYIEHTGKGVGAGKEEEVQLREWMQVLGLKPLIEFATGGTATAHVYHESRHQCALQSWVLALQSWAELLFELAGRWTGEPPPTEFKVDVFNDFGLSAKDQKDAELLLKMRTASPPEIKHETFLRELKRRGILSDAVDVVQEIEDLGEEDAASLFKKSASVDANMGEPRRMSKEEADLEMASATASNSEV